MPLQLEQTLRHQTSEAEQYTITIETNTPVITHQKLNNVLLQLEQTLCHQTSEVEQYTITNEANIPVITHQKLNDMSVICKVMPLSTPTINQPQQF